MFCKLFGYTKQAYYKQCSNFKDASGNEKQALAAVVQLRRQLPRLGTRKMHFLLKEEFSCKQLKIGRDKLFRLLRREGLLISKRKKYTVTTFSKHWMHKYPNKIKDIHLNRPEQLWVADITYLATREGNAYLHLITDAYSKQVMGYELCADLEAASSLKALTMALKNRQYPHQQLIHHSDRGLQYCSKLYVNELKRNGIQISMTENGDPYENAIAERMNGILKDEFGLGEELEDHQQAAKLTHQGVNYYNSLRPHLSCDKPTKKPQAFL
ncbi:IS3 family transposase [Solitalea sp. MAHUQ-68]|uniref:IS3 family transposase n=2 Tax=Sphingobacteriaceae TaxID=84566 RepID=A0A9X2JBG6_9SPHI|nr:IS3 family transposase [Solitalea agri]